MQNDNSPAAVLDPTAELILSDGTRITLRELSWKKTNRIISSLAERVAGLMNSGGGVPVSDLIALVVTDLPNRIASEASGLSEDELGELLTRDASQVVARAITLNIHPEMLEAGKAIAGRLAGVVTAATRSA